MKRKRLLVDVDEVLADFQTPVLQLVLNLFGRKMTPYDFEDWDLFGAFEPKERTRLFEEIRKPGFCLQFEPKEGAVEAVEELRKFADVIPVTRPFPGPTWAHDRTTWLEDKFGFKEPDIISTASKQYIRGDAFLDDNPKHVVEWMAEHPEGVGMLWHIPNTRKLTEYDPLRVRTWDEVVHKVFMLKGTEQ